MATVSSPATSQQMQTYSAKLKHRIDQQLDDLSKDVLPTAPYVLRLQQAHGRPLPEPSQQFYWWQGTPFSREEQELQYVSFRRNPGDLLQAHGQWDDGNGGLAHAQSVQSLASSGRTPLQSQGTKRKITLADYKNRDKSKPAGEDAAPAPPSRHAENIVSEGPEDRETVRKEDAKAHGEDVRAEAPSSRKDEKRAKETSTFQDSNVAAESAESSPAKRRQIPEQSGDAKAVEHAPDKGHAEKLAKQHDKGKIDLINLPTVESREVKSSKTLPSEQQHPDLPPMASPTIPSVMAYTLPPLLSPNLPPEIEAALAEIQAQRAKDRNKHRTADTLSKASSSLRPQDVQEKSFHVKLPVSSAGSKHEEVRPASQGTSRIGATPASRGVARPVSQGSQRNGDVPAKSKSSEWFTIKIKPSARKIIARLLETKPDPKVGHLANPRGRSNHQASAIVSANHIGPPTASKCIPGHGPDISRRLQSSQKRRMETPNPSTPGLPESSPPEPNSPSTKKIRLSNDFPASASILSKGSVQDTTSTAAGQSRHINPSTPSQEGLKAEYRAESERLIALGIELKHDSDKYLKQEHASEQQIELGLVTALESVLTFTLAGTVFDEPSRREGLARNVDTCRSTLPFLSTLKDYSEPFSYLKGILLQLEGVIRDTIVVNNWNIMRTQIREDTAPLYIQELRKIHDNETKSAAVWREGNAKLWVHDLKEAFPATWAKARQRSSSGKGHDIVLIGSYAQDGFALPMSGLTTGIEAVNAGMSLLEEYCKRREVNWSSKLVL